MWILECDGDVLKERWITGVDPIDKRLWLRPGKKYLFGRTARSDGGGFAIENKSISRKHLTIEVAPVKPGDVSKLHTKSQLTISDLNSKFGTQLDGEQIVGEPRILNGTEHEIKLGSYEHSIKWVPIVLSFSFSTKEQKNRDPLEPVRTRLEPLDIKASIPYVIGKTTHVVATKRNTAKGLQALINAKYIITDSFVDALVLAATPEPPNDPEGLSPLEVDFDKNWPDELSHLPAQSKEPSQRPSAFFAPDPRRANVFEGYIFIFCDNTQYENLHSPIANGGGKALLFGLRMGETTAEELLQYVKNVAGDKGSGELDDRGDGKGVVVVRFRGKKGMEKWSIELGNEVARKLDQRLIEQSEFLDAILVNDASGLRKTLPEEEHDDGEDGELPALPAPAASTLGHEGPHEHAEVASQSAPEPPKIPQQLSKRTRPRFVTSRFKGFDDGFNPTSLQQPSRVLSGTQIGNPLESDERTKDEPRSELSVQRNMKEDYQPFNTSQTQTTVSRKRSSPPSEDEDHDDVVNKILPAAAAMKKRRIAIGESSHYQMEIQGKTDPVKEPSIPQRAKSRKPRKEIDVLEAAREHREAEEDVARRDQEALEASLDGMEIDQIKNLALVEDMEVIEHPNRHPRVQAYGESGSRWDERWNGRKNFKRFRRREVGDGGQVRRGGGVIIGLEEVRKKDFGIGDGYWLEGNTGRGKQTESQGFSGLELPATTTVRAQSSKGSRKQQGNPRAVEQQGTSRLTDKANKGRQVESADIGKAQAPNKKRSASPTAANPNPPKKRNGLFVRQSDSDDSEDDLKFRFRRKR
ncbi:MAG: hypothetical protein M1840_004713 [Geoglossum simile]|nr:MAG: hypothetical protein M1840_004713 [Geoglossum simile]